MHNLLAIIVILIPLQAKAESWLFENATYRAAVELKTTPIQAKYSYGGSHTSGGGIVESSYKSKATYLGASWNLLYPSGFEWGFGYEFFFFSSFKGPLGEEHARTTSVGNMRYTSPYLNTTYWFQKNATKGPNVGLGFGKVSIGNINKLATSTDTSLPTEDSVSHKGSVLNLHLGWAIAFDQDSGINFSLGNHIVSVGDSAINTYLSGPYVSVGMTHLVRN
jgi:hypothetical protein